MKGYPKHLNTRMDYDFVLANFTINEWRKDFEALLNTRYEWYCTKMLDKEEDGVTDATHQVAPFGDESDGEATKWMQLELKYNENCRMEKLGFTSDEIEALLSEPETSALRLTAYSKYAENPSGGISTLSASATTATDSASAKAILDKAKKSKSATKAKTKATAKTKTASRSKKK